MTHILMVCLGNICRSPLAEGIMKSKLPSEGFNVDSAGTASYHIGSAPDRRSIAVAKKHGLNISNLKGRQFVVSDFDRFDYIYVMDASNYQNVLDLARTDADRSKVKFILNEVYPNENFDVPDPYYGGDDGFQNVYNMLDEACTKIANDLIS
ncbi:low molecular weight protein-tyrosine-phosphatase [Tamlana sp. 2_MG-2023]|uniref:low molecular weight protein-tyrosine-phosphatase n=1 Tax=unclassified Tamlana TaxID=2614803 RepID=UPI0026E302D2|nr:MULTISPECIES: low molecular weight protein-tyrosine-phosphatase [unclassified Tamlana]MDO6759087.1 low molecular weight protein-tyrosine-phosphatase [Tamlana sp. 2_MG-2023]MDO6789786.1 low molecular weight protein-tyrosine-phosphatase [Tamlana sp. 1_MG-2023]